jgi:hypothetical protein
MVQTIVHIALVAVFKDLYGNLWDLLELKEDHPIFKRNK